MLDNQPLKIFVPSSLTFQKLLGFFDWLNSLEINILGFSEEKSRKTKLLSDWTPEKHCLELKPYVLRIGLAV
jgi:hypothetical protein